MAKPQKRAIAMTNIYNIGNRIYYNYNNYKKLQHQYQLYSYDMNNQYHGRVCHCKAGGNKQLTRKVSRPLQS